MFLVSWLCFFILWLLGWKPISADTLRRLNEHPRQLLLFSHTTYVDFWLMLLYKGAYLHELPPLKVIVKPEPFAYAGSIITKLGGIKGASLEQRKLGSTAAIISQLTDERWALLISPKGTIMRTTEWKRGYYYIAQATGAALVTVGLDYEKHKVKLSTDSYFVGDIDEKDLTPVLQAQMGQIVPLFPDEEVVPVREHGEVSAIPRSRWAVGCILVGMVLGKLLI